MNDLFRLAVAAVAGYAVQYQAAKVQADNGAGTVTRLSTMGRWVIGGGVAVAVWAVYPVLLGQKGQLGGGSKLLAAAKRDCECGG